MDNVYLWKVGDRVENHTDLKAAAGDFGLTAKPDKTVTVEEWDKAEGMARIIDGKIFLGRTEKEIEAEKLAVEERVLLRELFDTDYKTIRASETGKVLAEVDPESHERRQWCRDRISEIRETLAGKKPKKKETAG